MYSHVGDAGVSIDDVCLSMLCSSPDSLKSRTLRLVLVTALCSVGVEGRNIAERVKLINIY